MSMLWRVSPGSSTTSLIFRLVNKTTGAAGGDVGTDEFFGLTVAVATGQGSETSDATGAVVGFGLGSTFTASLTSDGVGVVSDNAVITTGQGSETTDGITNIAAIATLSTGQGSETSDGVGTVENRAAITTGQGSETSDIATYIYLEIRPTGFWDNSETYSVTVPGLWRLNPSANSLSLISRLVSPTADDAAGAVGTDAYFEYTYAPTTDGMGAATIAWSSLAILPSGLDAGAFGAPDVANSAQAIVVSGLASSAYGTADVAIAGTSTQTITVAGLASSAYGGATVAVGTQYARVAGISSAAFGTDVVYNLIQSIYTAGIDSAEYGDEADVGYYERIIDVTGWQEETFGTDHTAYNLLGAPTLGNQFRTGLPHVYNFDREVLPAGISSAHFGTTDVELYTRYVVPFGIASLSMGGTQVWPYYLRAHGLDQSKFGTASVDLWIRYVLPDGLAPGIVWDDYGPVDPITGHAAWVHFDYNAVLPASIAPGSFGSTVVDNSLHGIEVADPIQPGVPGVPSVKSISYILVDGVDSAVYGDVDRWEAGKIKAHGDEMSLYGTPRIDRRITVAGIDEIPMPWPHLAVPLYPTGIAPPTFETQGIVAEYDCYFRHVANTTIGTQTSFGSASFHSPNLAEVGWDSSDLTAEYAASDYFAADYAANDTGIGVIHA